MTTELYTDKVPQYVHNHHTIYENTVLQEHSALMSDLKIRDIGEAEIESRARLLVGLAMRDKAEKLIKDEWQPCYDRETATLTNANLDARDKHAIAYHRSWIFVINAAMTQFIQRYRVDGSRAKIAVLDDVMPDGRRIVEVEPDQPVCFTDDEDGL